MVAVLPINRASVSSFSFNWYDLLRYTRDFLCLFMCTMFPSKRKIIIVWQLNFAHSYWIIFWKKFGILICSFLELASDQWVLICWIYNINLQFQPFEIGDIVKWWLFIWKILIKRAVYLIPKFYSPYPFSQQTCNVNFF